MSEREASAQPGVIAQRQVGQARETILHVSCLPANQREEMSCIASSVPRCLPLRSYTITSHVLLKICADHTNAVSNLSTLLTGTARI